jgi:hypothetical protein
MGMYDVSLDKCPLPLAIHLLDEVVRGMRERLEIAELAAQRGTKAGEAA